MPLVTRCEIYKIWSRVDTKGRVVGFHTRIANTCYCPTDLSYSRLKRNYEPLVAQWQPESHPLYLNEDDTDHHQCFLILFFVSVYKNLLFLYGYENLMNLCIGIGSRKVLWRRFPIIGQSGLVKYHSLSRRHRQYSRNSQELRVSR